MGEDLKKGPGYGGGYMGSSTQAEGGIKNDPRLNLADPKWEPGYKDNLDVTTALNLATGRPKRQADKFAYGARQGENKLGEPYPILTSNLQASNNGNGSLQESAEGEDLVSSAKAEASGKRTISSAEAGGENKGTGLPTDGMNFAKDFVKRNWSYFPTSDSSAKAEAGGENNNGSLPGSTQGKDLVSSAEAEAGGKKTSAEGGKENKGTGSGELDEPTGLEAYDRQTKTLQDMIDRLKEPESKEDREKRERREKARRLVSSLSDGLAALGNIYFTSRYAPDMYDGSRSMTTTYDKLLDKARAEREKNDQAYYNLAIKIGDLEKEKAKTLREMAAQAEKARIARETLDLKKNKDNREADLHEGKKAEQASKTKKAAYDADRSKTKSEYEPLLQDANLRVLKSREALNNSGSARNRASAAASVASANLSNARAAQIGRQGVTFNGKTYYNTDEYKKAVYNAVYDWNDKYPKDKIQVRDQYDIYLKIDDVAAKYENKGKKK